MQAKFDEEKTEYSDSSEDDSSISSSNEDEEKIPFAPLPPKSKPTNRKEFTER